jgi:hypothetical protein
MWEGQKEIVTAADSAALAAAEVEAAARAWKVGAEVAATAWAVFYPPALLAKLCAVGQ